MTDGKNKSGAVRVGRMTLGPVATNCYYVFRAREGADEDVSAAPAGAGEDGGEPLPVLLIDPPDAGERIWDALAARGFSVERILLTHAHFDHIGGIAGIERRAGERAEAAPDGTASGCGTPPRHIPVACLAAERPLCESPELNCSISMGGYAETIAPDEWLADGDGIEAAGISLRVIATPGHTAGGCCFYIEEAGLLFSGDTLFAGSVGRSDLPTGSMGTLVRSVREKLFLLPDDTLVLPGHGGETTIGDEKKYNPYVQ